MNDDNFQQMARYRIWVGGHPSDRLNDHFSGVTLSVVPADQPMTEIEISAADQAMLHGLLRMLYDLGLPLLALKRLSDEEGAR